VSSFFGLPPDETSPAGSSFRLFTFRYSGRHLRYEFWVHAVEEQVSISGDTTNPFGADSLFEFYVPCDSLSFVEDGYYPGQVALACWYGSREDPSNQRLTIRKRPDGDLKVWPIFPFPEATGLPSND
jgi:hypothetical protein